MGKYGIDSLYIFEKYFFPFFIIYCFSFFKKRTIHFYSLFYEIFSRFLKKIYDTLIPSKSMYSEHFPRFPCIFWCEKYRVDIGFVEIEFNPIEFSSLEEILCLSIDRLFLELSVWLIHLINLLTRRDDDSLTGILRLPYWHRSSPVARTRDTPVWC